MREVKLESAQSRALSTLIPGTGLLSAAQSHAGRRDRAILPICYI